MTFTDQEKAECAAREVKMRRRAYPRWVASGQMPKAQADREIAMMEEIASDYRAKTDLFGGNP